MAFPLDIRTELNLDGAWSDISPDVYVRDPMRVTRGLRDQGSAADPASLTLTLNNKGGKYSPRNAMSPFFGKLGRNTPVRVSVPTPGDHFLQLDGKSAAFVSTPDTAALDIVGDLDIRAEISPNWYGPDNQTLIGKWDVATNQRSYLLQIYSGTLYVRYSTDGTSAGVWTFQTPLPALPDRAAVRATVDVDNGRGGTSVGFYWSTSLDGPWTTIVEGSYDASTSSVFAGTAPLVIGPTDPTGTPDRLPMVGRAYRFEVRNGIGGPVVASPDFRSLAAGTRSFTDTAGRAWSLSGAAEVRDREDRFMGEISTWPLQWTPDDADVWTSITASGVLRRFGQGVKPLDSTLRRRIPSGNPTAYWPMEEERDATRAYSPIPGVQPATLSGVEWASWDTLTSSAPLPRLSQAASLSAAVPTATPGAWQVEFVYNADGKIPPAPGDAAEIIRFASSDGTVRRWRISMQDDFAGIDGFNAAGTKIVSQGVDIGQDVFVNGWVRLRFWAQDSGSGTFDWRINWEDVDGSAYGLTKTVAGTCGSLSAVSATWGSGTEGWGIGHLAVFPEANVGTFNGSDNAYAGESAWTRMRRLAAEEGVSLTRQPGPLPVQDVGFQRQDTLLNLLETAASADGGMLTEDPRRLGLRYRDRSSLYAQDPALTLSYTEPGLGPDLVPVDDDDYVQNDVTVTRDGGSSARAVLESGPLSVQPPPAGIGRYDTAYTLSLASDEQAAPIAYWKLHLGTFDGARYPSVTVMLHKPGAEALITAVLAMREGDKIRLTDLPAWVSNDDVDLIVNGWSEVLDLYRWEVTFTCAPAGPWDTARLNTVVEDFEDDRYAVSLSFAGSKPWARSSTRYQYGRSSLKSGAITNNQTSDAIVTLPPGARSLSFWYRTSSETSGPGFTGDYLAVLVNGTEVLRAQGETPWTMRTLDVSGASTVTFRYRKDNSAASGEDGAWIDHLVIRTGGMPSLRVAASSSFLAEAVNETATSLKVTTSSGPLWVEDPAELPFLIRVSGEVMRVTAVTPVSATSQTFTVTRSVNGVVKALPAGEGVNVATPPVTSL
ncbi:hypothetical protein [Streptomyces sp. bgisy032]|uniref:hypothetical protein n=1 Tax=Streptomyces sp. bgisy032 TaxID=3413773 RepID=UPI003D7394D3